MKLKPSRNNWKKPELRLKLSRTIYTVDIME